MNNQSKDAASGCGELHYIYMCRLVLIWIAMCGGFRMLHETMNQWIRKKRLVRNRSMVEKKKRKAGPIVGYILNNRNAKVTLKTQAEKSVFMSEPFLL